METTFGTFVQESGVELGRVVAVAANLPPDKNPEVGTVRSGKRAFCYATTRAWRGFGRYPITHDTDLLSRKAAGFMCAHECLAAERALGEILHRQGRRFSDLGRDSWELVLPDTYRQVVKSGKLCSEDEWTREFSDQRKRLPAGIVVTLSLEEQDDGTYHACAGVRLDCIHFGFCDMAHVERDVHSVEDVRELAREALGEVFPWILTPRSGEMIAKRDAEPIRKAIEERKEENLPDIPRWIMEMANNLVKEIPDKALPEHAEKPEEKSAKPKPARPRM